MGAGRTGSMGRDRGTEASATRRMRCAAIALLAAAAALALPAVASAGTLIASGHDMDYHCQEESVECEYLRIVVDEARGSSALPILAIDNGSLLKGSLLNAGFSEASIRVTNPNAPESFDAVAFTNASGGPLYSAIVVASDQTCGGCDMNEEGEANVNARGADFARYYDHGGGIIALAGAENYESYYDFLPLNVKGTVVSPPFSVEPFGASLGVTEAMANCCASHNSFAVSPTSPAAPFKVLEGDAEGNSETVEVRSEGEEETKEKEGPSGRRPVVKKLSVHRGPAAGGTTVVITGTGFNGATDVSFGSAAAEYTVDSSTRITVVSPPQTSGLAQVAVTTAGGTSALKLRDLFKYEAPTVTNVSPSSGPQVGGAEVTVVGSGFAAGSGRTDFYFGSALAIDVQCPSTTSCTMRAPAAHRAGSVNVRAKSTGRRSASTPLDVYTYME